jgi:hypothetical protein
LIRAGSGEISAKRIRIFLDAFQNKLCLEERELGLFVPILKAELVSALAGVCLQIRKNLRTGKKNTDVSALIGNLFTSLRF